MAVKRDLAAEQRAVGAYRARNGGQLPDLNDPKQRADVYRIAYPTTGGLPDELRSTVDESLYASGSSPAGGYLSQTVEGSQLPKLGSDLEAAKAGVQKTSQPNEALRILQEAIRAKSGQAGQSIGESELFKAAGVGGYGALSASLAAQGEKLDMDFANYSNIVGQMAGTYKDMATAALTNYQMAHEAYKEEVDRLQKIQDDIRDHGQAMDILQRQFEDSMKLNAYQQKLKESDPEYKAKLKEMGYLGVDENGNLLEDNDINNGIVKFGDQAFNLGSSYSAGSWAADQRSHAKAVQEKINEIGKFNSPLDIDAYIKRRYPKSPINSTMVTKASQKYGVPWEVIVAMMEHESFLGTSNVAVKNNNYAGVTWNSNYPESMKGTARPAKEGGYYVKFATPQDGLNEFTKFLANRKQSVSSSSSSDQYMQQFIALPTTAFGSVSAQKEAKKEFEKLIKSGNTSQADDLLNAWAYNSLTGTQKNDFSSFTTIESGIDSMLSEWDSLAMNNAGYYKNILEKAKPFAKVVKDQKWVDFISKIEIQQAKFRNAIYGASLTDNEKEMGTNFLVDPSRDDVKTILTKLQNMKSYASSLQSSYLKNAKGITENGKRPEVTQQAISSSENGSSFTSNSGKTYTLPY